MEKETENTEQTDKTEQTDSTKEEVKLSSQEQFSNKMDEILSTEQETEKENDTKKDESNIDNEDEEIQDTDADIDADEEKIDDEVLEILNEYGLKQETIDKILEESPELIAAIKEELDLEKKNDKPVKKDDKKTEQKDEFKELKIEIDPDLVDEKLKSGLDEIVRRINEQGKAIATESQKLKQEREEAFQNRIDSEFDRFEKVLPTLGNSSKLTENGYKQR
ncbi:MAG: hypothetical protein PHH82_04555, partial [Candidatus ainarchaeum sp.]|nr:hypothetical protein [Candidatus ainarchaeum sp.]